MQNHGDEQHTQGDERSAEPRTERDERDAGPRAGEASSASTNAATSARSFARAAAGRARSHRVLLVIVAIGIVFTASVLRSTITSMGALTVYVQDDLRLSSGAMGMVTTLPLLAFAASAVFMNKISERFGNSRALAVGCLAVALGIAWRSYGGDLGLFGGTILLGVGISAGNVLLPAVVRERFPLRVGVMTALYTTTMSLFAGGAAGVASSLFSAVPDWRAILMMMAPFATIGAVLWVVVRILTNRAGEGDKRGTVRPCATTAGSEARRPSSSAIASSCTTTVNSETHATTAPESANAESAGGASHAAPTSARPRPTRKGLGLFSAHIMKSPITWWITGLFAAQSILFYGIVAWLPSILTAAGVSQAAITTCVTLFPIVGIPCTLFCPPLAQRLKRQRGLGAIIGILCFAGVIALAFVHTDEAAIAAITLLGFALGAPFCLCMFYFGVRTEDPDDAAKLSSISQTFGYLLAALGPTCLGLIVDFTGSWFVPLVLMAVLAALVAVCGWKTGAGTIPAAHSMRE